MRHRLGSFMQFQGNGQKIQAAAAVIRRDFVISAAT
jgi:hypothetical protein